MAAYKDLVGQKITKVTSNPGEPKTGQMWYNSTSGTLRGLGIVTAWASGSPLSTARATTGGAGTQDSALIFAGTPAMTNTEEYNGSGFSAGGNLTTGRGYVAGCGTQTAGLGFGGYTTAPNSQGQALTEEYDGSSWSESGDLSTSRYGAGAAGTQTAGLAFGGYKNPPSSPVVLSATEEYNGTSWTTSPGTLGTARYELAGAGLQTAAIAALGYKYGSPLRTTSTEEYDGSTWTAGGNANTERSSLKGGGIQTSMLVFGGTIPPPGNSNATEAYNGTSWSNQPNLATARRRPGAASNTPGSTTGLCVGGQAPSNTGATEEFTSSTNTITAAAWASGGNLNQGRINVSMGGTQTAGIVLGGHQSPGAEPAAVETYNGSAFTSGTAIGPYTGDYAAYAGSQTQGIIFGGAPYTTNTAEYDGEWAAGGSLSQGRSDLMGAGTGETSAVAMGGFSPAPTARAETEEYGGTSWTSGGSLSTGRGQGAGFGIETAALVTGGEVSGGTKQSATEEYNGSSWTSGGSLITATGDYIGGWGTQTDGVVVGGGAPGYVTTTLGYDGTSFTTRPNAANPAGRTQTAGADGSAGLRAGGGPNTTQRDGSEEFTGETSATNITDFTTS